MGGHIDAYVDCVSLYSYLATLRLLENKSKLATHGVTLEFHPIFLGGVNVGSGNKPPWTLPAKAVYGKYDAARALAHNGVGDSTTPDFFPILSLLPQRLLTHLHLTSSPLYIPILLSFFRALWHAPHYDLSSPTQLHDFLLLPDSRLSTPPTAHHAYTLTASEADALIRAAQTAETKAALTATTEEVLRQGAFGAPWFRVRNDETGKVEPFFGSDRFGFMWEFLGLPWRDVELLAPTPVAGAGGVGADGRDEGEVEGNIGDLVKVKL